MVLPNVSGGHVRQRRGKIWEKEFSLENGKTSDDSAIGQMSGFLNVFAVVGILGDADFRLEDFHQLFDAVFLSAKLFEGLEYFAQLARSLIVSEAVNVFTYVLFHGSLQLLSTIQSLAVRPDWFIARSW
jgi:hypothetical protein